MSFQRVSLSARVMGWAGQWGPKTLRMLFLRQANKGACGMGNSDLH